MNHCANCLNHENKPNQTCVISKHSNEALSIDIGDTKILSKRSECKQNDNVNEKIKEAHIKTLLAHIDKTPIKCPISRCSQLIGITSVMRHFLRDHRSKIPVDFHECYEGERIGLKFSETMLKYEETICLGVLAYGGIETVEKTRPGKSGLSLNNFMLPENYSQLIAHMAITILACKVSLRNIYTVESFSDRNTLSNDDIVVIWLAAAETTRKVHCTVTAFTSSSSRSAVVEIQNLKTTNPKNFLKEKTDFLILNRGDINILSNNQQNSIELEISIQEIKSNQCEDG